MKKLLLIVSFSLILIGCSTTHKPKPAEYQTGFLPNYKSLTLVPDTPKNIQVLKYNNPSIPLGDFHAVIIKPVMLYQSVTKNGVKKNQLVQTRMDIQQGIKQIAMQKNIQITNQPGPGVAMLQVAITGAQVDAEGLKPRNLMPISAAIQLATRATDTNKKHTAMVVELKFTDSQSGKLLREVVTIIQGEEFRDKAHTRAQFENLAQSWVQAAMKYSSQHPSRL